MLVLNQSVGGGGSAPSASIAAFLLLSLFSVLSSRYFYYFLQVSCLLGLCRSDRSDRVMVPAPWKGRDFTGVDMGFIYPMLTGTA